MNNAFIIDGTVEKYDPKQGKFGAWCTVEIESAGSRYRLAGNEAATIHLNRILLEYRGKGVQPLITFSGTLTTWKADSGKEYINLKLTSATIKTDDNPS